MDPAGQRLHGLVHLRQLGSTPRVAPHENLFVKQFVLVAVCCSFPRDWFGHFSSESTSMGSV